MSNLLIFFYKVMKHECKYLRFNPEMDYYYFYFLLCQVK